MIPIHVINLESRPDRKLRVQEELCRHGLTDFNFVQAVNGRELPIDQMIADGGIRIKDRRLRDGEYGCYLSHLSVMQTILQSEHELHIVLEDDVQFAPHFLQRLNVLLRHLQNLDWDIFYLGLHNSEKEDKIGERFKGGVYAPDKMLYGTHAYIMKKQTVNKIIDCLLPVVLPWDVILMDMPSLKRLALIYPIVKVIDIDDSDTLKEC